MFLPLMQMSILSEQVSKLRNYSCVSAYLLTEVRIHLCLLGLQRGLNKVH